jgi:hypothetical protein
MTFASSLIHNIKEYEEGKHIIIGTDITEY